MGIRWSRVGILVGFAGLGYSLGGFSGAIYTLFIFCFCCFVFYAIMDGMHTLVNFFRRPTEVFLTLDDEKGVKGHPDIEGTGRINPDPTRPDADDMAGLITYRLGSGRGYKGN